MPEELKVDCMECKDLAFARNLASQMKEGYGRHNSNRSVRNASQNAVFTGEGAPETVISARPGSLYYQLDAEGGPALWGRFDSGGWRRLDGPLQARVVGRFGEKAIRERAQDCEIGDAVPESLFPTRVYDPGQNYATIILDIPKRDDFSVTLNDITTGTFERVRCEMTSLQGGSFEPHYFWKRIS